MPETLYIIDGTALVYRSYFAFIKSPLYSSKGENTSASYGFAHSVIRLLKDRKPDYFAIAFDRREPTFRHKMYSEYKATREKMPDELVEQLPRISQIVEALNIKKLEIPGYEADDIIGTLAVRAADAGLDVYVVTGDKDLMQLVNDKIYWMNLKKSGQEPEILDPEGVKEKFGVLPEQVVDMLSLMGDSSDNVPGVAGVGKVTALKLINEYGSLDNIYENIENIQQKKLKEKLVNDKEKAYLSKDLVVLDCNVQVEYDNEALKTAEPDAEASVKLFKELEFRYLVDIFLKEETAKRETNYHTVMTMEALDDLVENLEKYPFAFDTETTSLDELNAELVGLSFSWKENEAFYVPVTAPDKKPEFTLEDILAKLGPVLEDAAYPKCAQNAKYDMLVLGNYGINVLGLVFDTMIASHLIDPDWGGNDLDFLSRKYLDIIKIPTTDLIGKGKDQKNMADIPLETVAEYACEDADCTFQLWKILEPEVTNIKSMKLFTETEIPLIPVLAEMEREGV
ncbi:MAG: DNA polymerase I, partial [bacterium]|nr:DNA polymerase I [bacterium]